MDGVAVSTKNSSFLFVSQDNFNILLLSKVFKDIDISVEIQVQNTDN